MWSRSGATDSVKVTAGLFHSVAISSAGGIDPAPALFTGGWLFRDGAPHVVRFRISLVEREQMLRDFNVGQEAFDTTCAVLQWKNPAALSRAQANARDFVIVIRIRHPTTGDILLFQIVMGLRRLFRRAGSPVLRQPGWLMLQFSDRLSGFF